MWIVNYVSSVLKTLLPMSSRSSYISWYGIFHAPSFNRFLELLHIGPIVRVKNDWNVMWVLKTPNIGDELHAITLFQISYKTNFANSVCNLPLTKLWPISKDGASGKWYYLDLFYENQNDKHNTELDEIGFVWTSSCTRFFSNRK